MNVYDTGGNLVTKLVSGANLNIGQYEINWDGKDISGYVVGGSTYYIHTIGTNPVTINDIWEENQTIIVDHELPTAQINYIQKDDFDDNKFKVFGTAFDKNIDYYKILLIHDDTSEEIETFNSLSVENSELGTIDTSLFANGTYTIRLVVMDMAGNSSTDETDIFVDHTSNAISINVHSISQSNEFGSDGYLPTSDDQDVWIEDDLPSGSTEKGNWAWDYENTYSGLRSHTNSESTGIQGHYFIHADKTLQLEYTDNIIQYVYMDPVHPPKELLLQFYTNEGDGEHRAYWGENFIPTGGEKGSASLYHMGNMPTSGKWLRLLIPANRIGLSGKDVKGIAFVTYNGKAYWDKTTKSTSYNENQKKSWMLASQKGSDDETRLMMNYSINQYAAIKLSIYDEDNNHIRTLIDQILSPGSHMIAWNGKDDDGTPVSFGKYYFQFNSYDGPIVSNSYALQYGENLPQTLEPETTVFDSSGNQYKIDTESHIIQKLDIHNNEVLRISSQNVGQSSFLPHAIDIDINDNLIVLDKSINKLYKLDANGYLIKDFSNHSIQSWSDQAFVLNQPDTFSVDDNGDIILGNNNGNTIEKLAVGRGVIDISNITANIRVPYEKSMLYAYIPVIGTASARNFQKYVLDYGVGDNPTAWTDIVTSYSEVFDDYKPIPGVRTIYGNLGTFKVTTHPYQGSGGLPMGTYTIRLRVFNKSDQWKEDRVQVEVGRIIRRGGGSVVSNDGLAKLYFPKSSIADDVDVFAIKEIDTALAPEIKDPDIPDLKQVGKIYEILPAGYQFLQTCTLTMYYTNEQVFGTNESSLKLYRWNPVINKWIYVFADLNMASNSLTTQFSKLNDGIVYYAILSDPPPAPIIYQPTSPTNFKQIPVSGKASQSVKVEVFVNNISQGITLADENTGRFQLSSISLQPGDNTITAQAFDPVGNKSELSKTIMVQLIMGHPSDISSLTFMTSDFSQAITGSVGINDDLNIQLIGTDINASMIDATTVWLKSMSDPTGITLQLMETTANSGIYIGRATVGEISHHLSSTIGVSSKHSETISVISTEDQAKTDHIETQDKTPPPAPIVTSISHPSLCQNTFEVDMGQWKNMSNTYGARVNLSHETHSTGESSLQLLNEADGGDFGAYIVTTAFDARQYPLISFDYKIPDDIKLNMVALVNGMWKEIVFTDDPKTVETFDEADIYRTIGKIDHVVADNTWQHASFNLYNMLRNDDPDQETYIVEELFFADYNLPGWMELVMGNENAIDATWYVDNLIISTSGSSDKDPVFTWTTKDSSVAAYSFEFNQSTNTLPDQQAESESYSKTYHQVADGTWYFHIRSVDFAGNWGPANHYQVIVDANGPIADSPIPADEDSSGNLEVRIRVTDGTGSGVDPDTIALKLNHMTFGMDSGGIVYDEKSGWLTFSLWKVKQEVVPWENGDLIKASLITANDYAGNALQNIFNWEWTVDYTKMESGYLTLLTSKGGFTPSWSPDATKIAFMSERDGKSDIWTIQANDFAERNNTALKLTEDEFFTDVNSHHPSWSPVNHQIVFVSNTDGNDHIFMIDATNKAFKQLTSEDSDDSHPYFSPDGTQIVFSRNNEIWIMDSDGTNQTQLTHNSIEYLLDPVWSPDGHYIAFTRSLYVDEVGIMNANGTDHFVLTENGKDSLPAWVENDKLLYVSRNENYQSAIHMVNLNGSDDKKYLENQQWWDSEPAYSSKGENIAIQSTRNGSWNIWVKTQLSIPTISVSPEIFSPDNDGIKDSCTISFTLIGGNATGKLEIYDTDQNIIISLANDLFQAGQNQYVWDGKDSEGNLVADGMYHYMISIDGNGDAEKIEKQDIIQVDTSPPSFEEWTIPLLTDGPIQISVLINDATQQQGLLTRLQYGIASTDTQVEPDIIGWTDLSTESVATLDIDWKAYKNNFLYIRAFSEDNQGNTSCSSIQKRKITKSALTAFDQTISTNEDTQIGVELEGNDPEGNTFIFTIITSPIHGILNGNPPNVTYVPDSNFYGNDSFTYKIYNNENESAPATIMLTINPMNDKPVADAGSDQSVNVGTIVLLNSTNSSDIEDNILTYHWRQLSGNEAELTSPDSTQCSFEAPDICPGQDTLTFQLIVADSGGLTSSDTCQINISCNTPPSPPTLAMPSPMMQTAPLNMILRISHETPFADRDGGTHGHTQWQISQNNTFNELILDMVSDIHLMTYPLLDLLLDEGLSYYCRVRFIDNSGSNSEWSEIHQFSTTVNEDDINPHNGIPDHQEGDILALNLSDDVDKDNVKCLKTFDENHTIGLSASSSITITALKSIDPATITDTRNQPKTFPVGLIAFKLVGENKGFSASLTAYFSEAADTNAFWLKYTTEDGWQKYSDYSNVMFNEDRTQITFTLQDGGYGDSDGIANGIIVDPSGLGIYTSSTPDPNPTTGGGDGGGGGCFILASLENDIIQSSFILILSFIGLLCLLKLIIGIKVKCKGAQQLTSCTWVN
jgi:Tol biopolymer transport system component/flagellar hook assembly protein FlgD